MLIYNTLTREKQKFEPLASGRVGMYVCGITSSGPPHIGHARSYVAFDVVYRWLSKSYSVNYVRNFTDVDDKIILAAGAAGEDISVLSQRNMEQFSSDMKTLGCAPPSLEPRVTEHIPDMIKLIARLIDRGFAYVSEGDVYFEVRRFEAYGKLSGRTIEKLNLEAYRAWASGRGAGDPRKAALYDFALWKASKPGEPSWATPWGPGRPGWHIECSAMSTKYLGEPFDLHCGGHDLVFPHHENEIAQTCAANGSSCMARFWLHNGFVNLTPERCPRCARALGSSAVESGCRGCGYILTDADLKMSKSRGNFYPVREIASRYQAEALRHLMLMHHYRSPVQFSHGLLEDTQARTDRIYDCLRRLDRLLQDAKLKETQIVPGKSFAETFSFDPRASFISAMDDDFHTPKALGVLSEVLRTANDLLDLAEARRPLNDLSIGDALRLLSEIRSVLREAGAVLGLWQEDPRGYLERRRQTSDLTLTPSEVQALVEERTLARKAKNFKRSDEIRGVLLVQGVALKDTASGTEWYPVER